MSCNLFFSFYFKLLFAFYIDKKQISVIEKMICYSEINNDKDKWRILRMGFDQT